MQFIQSIIRKKKIRQVVSESYRINRLGIITPSELEENEDWLATIQDDYDSGRINGSLLSYQKGENGFGSEIPLDMELMYKTESGTIRRLSLGLCSDFVTSLIAACLDTRGVDWSYVQHLSEVESFLETLAHAIDRGSGVEGFFTMIGKIEWKGQLTELANFAIDEVKCNRYRNLGVACRKLTELYMIDGETINTRSLHSLARQIQSQNR